MAIKIRNFSQFFNFFNPNKINKHSVPLKQTLLSASSATHSAKPLPISKIALIVGGFGVCGGAYGYLKSVKPRNTSYILHEKTNFTRNDNIPNVIPSREVSGPASHLGLNLTLYQYQTCPFCCKVRAFLEFYGIPFKVVEVNPVMRQQLKFSKYKKVPILIAEDKEASEKHQLNDSTVIISILGTFLNDLNGKMQQILEYYTPMTYKDEDGKEIEEVLNKYFLMYGNQPVSKRKEEDLEEERKWRKWADQELVHILSPNIYRTYDEAIQAFNYFSEVGEWEKNFSSIERLTVIYVGATAMYFVGKKLKKKYTLKDDVRQSLYDSCKLWMKEIGPTRKFMGGDKPNLADLAVYGLLNSIEGCIAFQDLLQNTNIAKWYYSTKEAVTNHYGYQTLKI